MAMGISSRGRHGRRAVTLLAAVGIAAGLGFGLSPAAGAAAVGNGRVAAKVTVQVTQKGNYTAAICVTDNLGGTCQTDVRKGQTKTFTVEPAKGTPVNVRVVPNGGGSAEKSVVSDKTKLKFETAGSKAKPTVKQVS
ncbi:hypothetical protein AB0I22_21080 [Streptomyces sp. NPDC050610]|uniref:hypothetical protein n=1 Tax=Streptomyces sp. NPDC050610 TaxID=3157097 RepID=UPI003412D8F3